MNRRGYVVSKEPCSLRRFAEVIYLYRRTKKDKLQVFTEKCPLRASQKGMPKQRGHRLGFVDVGTVHDRWSESLVIGHWSLV